MIDVKKISTIKKSIKVLINEYNVSLVQEKVNESFKSLYSVRGL
jgi:hypothetical protein